MAVESLEPAKIWATRHVARFTTMHAFVVDVCVEIVHLIVAVSDRRKADAGAGAGLTGGPRRLKGAAAACVPRRAVAKGKTKVTTSAQRRQSNVTLAPADNRGKRPPRQDRGAANAGAAKRCHFSVDGHMKRRCLRMQGDGV
jgi:hypothetical protein